MHKGFTLVELVMVIVILGILSAFALPKFANFTQQSQVAKLEGLKASIHSAVGLTQSYARIQNKLDGAIGTSIDYNGNTVQVQFGYPRAVWTASIHQLIDMDAPAAANSSGELCTTGEFCGAGNLVYNSGVLPSLGLSSGRVAVIWPEGFELADECFVYYNNPNTGAYPNIGIVSDGCN